MVDGVDDELQLEELDDELQLDELDDELEHGQGQSEELDEQQHVLLLEDEEGQEDEDEEEQEDEDEEEQEDELLELLQLEDEEGAHG